MTARDITEPQHVAGAPRWVAAFNPLARVLLRLGLPLGPNGLITVPGRSTGKPRTTPLAIIEIAGRRWVWAPWGDVNWVRNLRAAGEATLSKRGRELQVRAVELDREERVAFFRDTLGPIARRIPFGRTFVRLVDGVDINDPVEAGNGRPVFELRPFALRPSSGPKSAG